MAFNNYRPVNPRRPQTHGCDTMIPCPIEGIKIVYLGVRHPASICQRGSGYIALGLSAKSATGAMWSAISRCGTIGMEAGTLQSLKDAMNGSKIRGIYRTDLPKDGRQQCVVVSFDTRHTKLNPDLLTALNGARTSDAGKLLRSIDRKLSFKVIYSDGSFVTVDIVDHNNTVRGTVRLEVK